MKKAKLLICRGISGSGKSTLAKELHKKYPDSKMFAADDYFMKDNKYEFDSSKLGQAHKACYDNTLQCLKSGFTAIVHNTFTTYKELKPYLELIDRFECEYAILEPSTSWKNNPDECFKMNVHNVPFESIIKMQNRWQNEEQILKLWQEDRNAQKNQEKVKTS